MRERGESGVRERGVKVWSESGVKERCDSMDIF